MQKLADIRKQRNFTCQKIADKTDMKKEQYIKIEKKESLILYEEALKISACFNLQPDDILWPINISIDRQ